MRTLAGMQPPLAGHVRLGDSNLHKLPPAELAKRLAVVLTEHVRQSFGLCLGCARSPPLHQLARASERTGSTNRGRSADPGACQWILAPHAVNELSDGERQRVMIARALAQLVGEGGKVLILDEPTAFLDLPRRVEMMQLLGMLARTSRRAVLLSTHDRFGAAGGEISAVVFCRRRVIWWKDCRKSWCSTVRWQPPFRAKG